MSDFPNQDMPKWYDDVEQYRDPWMAGIDKKHEIPKFDVPQNAPWQPGMRQEQMRENGVPYDIPFQMTKDSYAKGRARVEMDLMHTDDAYRNLNLPGYDTGQKDWFHQMESDREQQDIMTWERNVELEREEQDKEHSDILKRYGEADKERKESEH